MSKRDREIFKSAGCGVVAGAIAFAAAWQFTQWPLEYVILLAVGAYLAGACAMLDLTDRRKRARRRLKIDPEMASLTWMIDEKDVLDKRIEASQMMAQGSMIQRIRGEERARLLKELGIWR